MKRKSIFALILFSVFINSTLLDGCGNAAMRRRTNINNNATTQQGGDIGTTQENETTSEIGDETTNRNSSDLTDAARDTADRVVDSANYTAMNFRDDFAKAGYQLKESTNTARNYFGGNETDYMAGNDVVRVYEYNSAQDLEGDINRISQNGLTINGTNANYTRTPYYYRKGNSLIVYEGNEPSYVNQFNTMYGNPLIP